jgi:hypothetical protein
MGISEQLEAGNIIHNQKMKVDSSKRAAKRIYKKRENTKIKFC